MMAGVTTRTPYGEGAVAYTNVTGEDYVMAEHKHAKPDEDEEVLVTTERTTETETKVEGVADEDAVDPGAPDEPAPDADSSPQEGEEADEEEKEPKGA